MTRHASPPGAGRSVAAYPFLLPPVEADEIGRLGNYRVISLLGRGGMGYVFHAEDLTLRRPVALKVMKPDLEGAMKGWQRFLREARLMAAIKHDSLVTVFQAGQEGDVVYLAMELLQGTTLADWVADNPNPSIAEILRLAREIAGALAVIHQHGLVHRDIKPANLWLETPGQRVKILDFGLARYVEDRSLTQTGAIVGTPSFMSPEQARGDPVDARSDLFSFGCILYYLCTGQEPFHAENTAGTLTALALLEPRRVRQLNPSIPRGLSDLVDRLLAKNVEDRPASAEAVLKRLRQVNVADSAVSSPTAATKPKLVAAGADSKTGRLSKRRKNRPKANSTRNGKPLLLAGILAVMLLLATGIGLLIFKQVGPKGATAAPGEMVYLSSLNAAEEVNWPFLPPPPPGMPPHKPIGSVRVQGTPSPHGIFMHPPHQPGGSASISYNIARQYAKFQAQVTYNDGPPRSYAPCIFSVYGDGKLLWKSLPIYSQQDAQTCSVPVSGVNQLKIAVLCEGEPKGAHAVWVEPGLMKE